MGQKVMASISGKVPLLGKIEKNKFTGILSMLIKLESLMKC